MNPIEKLRCHILRNYRSNPSDGIHYLPITLASEFGLQEDHVKQILAEMEEEGLVTLAASGNYFVVTVTARGAELLVGIPRSAIGFNTE